MLEYDIAPAPLVNYKIMLETIKHILLFCHKCHVTNDPYKLTLYISNRPLPKYITLLNRAVHLQ